MILRLAELNIEYQPLYPSFRDFVGAYIREAPAADISVVCTQEDIVREQEKADAEARTEGRPPRVWPPEYLETLAVYRKIAERAPFYDTVLFHGSVIAVDGQAYLFTAKSGTGKSTHTRLWRELFGGRAVMINDDKPLLRLDREGTVYAYGTPWDGKHHLSTCTGAPLKALCILTRDTYNHIEAIEAAQGYELLLQQIYRPADGAALMKTLTLLDRILETVPLYKLGCNMEAEAAVTAYEGMQKR